MPLQLSIENVSSLPDGGPVSFNLSGRRSIDIGRDQHLDWTLPDPTRYISGKHCEIHWRDNSYWLHDVSTNGTFLYGTDQRVRSPHELKNGDRLVIGHYIVNVAVDDTGRPAAPDRPTATAAYQDHASYPELWTIDRDAPPPIDRRQMLSPREAARPVNPDFLDWAAGVPDADIAPTRPRRPTPFSEPISGMDWASGPPSPQPAVSEPAIPIVTPRRPTSKDEDSAALEANPFIAAQPRSKPTHIVDEPDSVRNFNPPPQRSVAVEVEQVQPSLRSNTRAGDDFARRVARAAELPEHFFASKDSDQLADQFGSLMRLTVSNLMVLLQARNAAKRLTRSTAHTTIQATENNPLKFSPTPEDAMRILFGPKTHSYMEARKAFEEGFDDLKSHQLKTYAAMQHAVTMLIADLDPADISKGVDESGGALDKLLSRKSRQWDTFVTRWKATLGREPSAAIEAFMLHFADYYDRDKQ